MSSWTTVMDEVCALFPGAQVHMGGRVPTGVWTDSPACRQLMTERGYTDCRELRGHLRHCQHYPGRQGASRCWAGRRYCTGTR